jgi:hypothetical protein
MRISRKSDAFLIFALVALASVLATSFSAAQEKSDDALKKEYGLILGEYEFDATEMGGGTFVLNYFVKDGNLWADSGDGRPAIMQPVEGETFSFRAEDPVGGAFKIKFEKDEQGAYTKSRVFIEMAGVEVVGRKIK